MLEELYLDFLGNLTPEQKHQFEKTGVGELQYHDGKKLTVLQTKEDICLFVSKDGKVGDFNIIGKRQTSPA